jgi:hypothetical protein
VTQRRRITDRLPDTATRREVTDRLKIIQKRAHGDRRLEGERWSNHGEKHRDLAQQLLEYKTSANEWRATLADVTTKSVTRSEYQAEHKALDAKLTGAVELLDGKVDQLAALVQRLNDRDNTTRDVLNSGRNLILIAIALIGVVLAVLTYLARA